MNKTINITLILIVSTFALGQIKNSVHDILLEMVNEDQAMRSNPDTDPGLQQKKDTEHREVVLQLLAETKIVEPEDKYFASLILQHTHPIFCDEKMISISRENYLLAHYLAKSSAEAGYEPSKRLTAMTLDRYLWFNDKPQKYGTNFHIKDDGSKDLEPYDKTTTDEERAKWNVEPLNILLGK